MIPKLQKERTSDQLAEIFRQLAEQPLTSLLSAPALRFTGFSEAGTAAASLLRECGYDDCPFAQGAEAVMLAGDFAFLIETVVNRLQKNEYGTRNADPRELVEDLMGVFLAWASHSDTLKKGVKI